MSNPFRYFNSSPEVIRLVVMMYVRYPLSLRNVEDLLAERGIDISHETVRFSAVSSLGGRCHGARGLRHSLQPSSEADDENQLPRVSFPA